MGKSQRNKGKVGEREVANILKERGYDAHRGVQYQGGSDSPDVIGLPGVHIEVKRVNSLRLYPSLEQSRNDADDSEIPIVVHRPDHKQWVAIMDLNDFLWLYEGAREASYEGCSPIPERVFGTFKPW